MTVHCQALLEQTEAIGEGLLNQLLEDRIGNFQFEPVGRIVVASPLRFGPTDFFVEHELVLLHGRHAPGGHAPFRIDDRARLEVEHLQHCALNERFDLTPIGHLSCDVEAFADQFRLLPIGILRRLNRFGGNLAKDLRTQIEDHLAVGTMIALKVVIGIV